MPASRSRRRAFACFALVALVSAAAARAQEAGKPAPKHTFTVSGGQFLLDGKPFRFISGEMHYPRVPRAYWRDRLRKAKAMGLNTITTYAFWNLHEPSPGVYDFSGENDIAEYIREAQQEGLHVVLRPGPYICAEWELGGYPSWLLKDRSLLLRSTDPVYTAAVDRWLKRLAQEVGPLLVEHGGPILAVQLENEYGAYGDDPHYLEQLKGAYQRAGLGDGVLFTSNQAGDLAKGSLPELPSVVNFGSGGAAVAAGKLQAFRPKGVRMVGEYWAGWFDKWGEEHHETDGAEEGREMKFLLDQGYSVSLYMFHGGSNFGWMNGADSHTGKDYHPDTQSYDYDAPLDEAGNPREKYALLQKVFAAAGSPTGPLPQPSSRTVFAVSAAQESASLWRNLPVPVTAKAPLAFEDLDQSYGYVLYRVGLDAGEGGVLDLAGLHSYAQVYLDQQLVDTADRRLGKHTIALPVQTRAVSLDILVENTGRVNYSHAITTERAGITGEVTLAGKPLTGRTWEMFSLPMNTPDKLRFHPEPCTGPCFFRFAMSTPQPGDTYLDTRGLHKGQLWVGEHNLGRFWSIGPQYTMYTPAPWLTARTTPVTVFDLKGDATERLGSVRDPVFGVVTHQRENQ